MTEVALIQGLGIVVIASAMFALAARRVRLPTIVAYLLAGLLLGPLTGLVTVTEGIQLVSDAGIVLLLFVVGLELSFDKIRVVGRTALIAGVGQVALTAAAAWLLVRVLGMDTLTSLLVAIAVISSSTVVVVKLLDDRQEQGTLAGRIAVGVSMVQDLVVIILLTFLAGLTTGGELDAASVGIGIARALGGMALLLGGVLLLSRFVLRAPLAWAARSPDTLFIWSLAWCFAVVFGAELLNVSAATGAFIAGISLAQLPYESELRRRVNPLMSFFVAIFFVSLGIGMQLDPAAVDWGMAIVLALFVLVVKPLLVIWLVARLGYSPRTAFDSGILLGQISEFSFIFAAVAVASGLADPPFLSLIGLVGLVSIAASSVMITRREALFHLAMRSPLRRLVGTGADGEASASATMTRSGHVIVVGMNSLGREIASRLHERGETVLAIDSDPGKLESLPCDTLLGNAEYLSLLLEAGLPRARLLVSALRIEDANDLLAYRCRSLGIQCAIHVIDLSVIDTLLEMDTTYLMIPKVDGVKLQTRELHRMGMIGK
jgi:Kef-type K+ transport system membrane component KefB